MGLQAVSIKTMLQHGLPVLKNGAGTEGLGGKVRARQVRIGQFRVVHIRVGQVRVRQVCEGQECQGQVRAGQKEVRPQQVDPDVVDPVVVGNPRQERPALQKWLDRFLSAVDGVGGPGLVENVLGLPLDGGRLFRREKLSQHQEAECLEVGYLPCR